MEGLSVGMFCHLLVVFRLILYTAQVLVPGLVGELVLRQPIRFPPLLMFRHLVQHIIFVTCHLTQARAQSTSLQQIHLLLVMDKC